jgi:sodium/bile acid cotransporter 7
LGYTFPSFGANLNPRGATSKALIVLLFLISGFSLPTESIGKGLRDWRLHLFCQSWIFIVAPAYFLLTTLPLKHLWPQTVLVGIYALACMPTTVSSCIVFTQLSGGNVMGTIFNAAVSNMAGVVISPLLLSLMMQGTAQPLPVSEVLSILGDLALLMLVPLSCGQVLRRLVPRIARRHAPRLGVASNIFILAVVFFSIAATALNPSFAASLREMLLPFAYLGVSHLLLLLLAYLGTRALLFSQENVISVLFVAPQKTLAAGVPILATFFANSPSVLGQVMLPLLFYHAWQLIVAGFLRNRFAAPPYSKQPPGSTAGAPDVGSRGSSTSSSSARCLVVMRSCSCPRPSWFCTKLPRTGV